MQKLIIIAFSLLLLSAVSEGGQNHDDHDDHEDDEHDCKGECKRSCSSGYDVDESGVCGSDKKCCVPVTVECKGECKRKCSYGFGEDYSANSCGSKKVCCVKVPNTCWAVGGFCVKTKECPEHYKSSGSAGVLCKGKRAQCCVPNPGFYAKCTLTPASDKLADQVYGTVHFKQAPGKELEYTVNLEGFDSSDDNRDHALHVHHLADPKEECAGAGDPFSPDHSSSLNIGNFGNIRENNKGKIRIISEDHKAALSGEYSIIGRSLVVFQHGGDSHSEFGDDPGKRLACCVIGYVSGGHWQREKEELQTAGLTQS